MATICSALFAARSPPRLRRCRTVFPEDASTGLTPHKAVKLASDRNRSGLSRNPSGAQTMVSGELGAVQPLNYQSVICPSLTAICRLAQLSMHTTSGAILNWNIAMDQRTDDTLSEFYIEIFPPDHEGTCASDARTCPCCLKLRPASSMDDDGCGICDECLKP